MTEPTRRAASTGCVKAVGAVAIACIILGGVLVMMLVLASGAAPKRTSGSEPPAPKVKAEAKPPHDASDAHVLCRRFVKERLRAPATAKFERTYSGETTVHLGDGRYRVRSYVDAENAFGALIRSQYDCTVQWVSGSRYELVSLSIE